MIWRAFAQLAALLGYRHCAVHGWHKSHYGRCRKCHNV